MYPHWKTDKSIDTYTVVEYNIIKHIYHESISRIYAEGANVFLL